MDSDECQLSACTPRSPNSAFGAPFDGLIDCTISRIDPVSVGSTGLRFVLHSFAGIFSGRLLSQILFFPRVIFLGLKVRGIFQRELPKQLSKNHPEPHQVARATERGPQGSPTKCCKNGSMKLFFMDLFGKFPIYRNCFALTRSHQIFRHLR